MKKKEIMSNFKNILDFCVKRGFLTGQTPQNINLSLLGSLLSNNLRSEWLYNNVTNRDVNIFLNSNSSISETYNFAKEFIENNIPFGIAEIKPSEKCFDYNESNEVSHFFNKQCQTSLTSYLFVPPSSSDQLFYNWLNQRRIWWRKISALPSRYSLTDIQTRDNKQNVEIIVEYPWGKHILESITLDPCGHPDLTKEQLQVKNGRKKATAYCIKNTTYLFTMTLNTLCDAYDDNPYQGIVNPVLRFHRKIAPYKISFTVANTDPSILSDLNDLALFLCKKLRKAKFSCLFIPNSERNLDAQFLQYDEAGIPYSVLLEDDTLKTGLAYLRSRDTTLKEQIHVSNLQEYVEQLLKNY